MKKQFYIIILCFVFQFNFAQELLMESELVEQPDVINPKFNGGGLDKFYQFLNKNFDFYKVTKPGKMIASFSVDENGEVKKIRVIQFVDVESATEIIRVLKLSPKWQPAVKNGKPISVEIKLPFNIITKELLKTDQIVETSKTTEQNTVIENKSDELVIPANVLEVQPEYPDGIKEFYAFIIKNFISPDQPGLNGKVVISFVVEIDGSLGNFKILKDVGYGSGEEAIRVFKLMPLWKPGMQKGIPVRCQYTIPITINTPK